MAIWYFWIRFSRVMKLEGEELFRVLLALEGFLFKEGIFVRRWARLGNIPYSTSPFESLDQSLAMHSSFFIVTVVLFGIPLVYRLLLG